MHPLEFMALNLRHGAKVTLCLKHKPNEPIECYFKGYRTLGGKRVALDAKDLVPVFCKVAKNGSMSNTELFDFIDFGSIKSVTTENVPVLSLDDIHPWDNAVYMAGQTAYNQIVCMMRELSTIFPGKRILLTEPWNKGVNVVESHGGLDSEFPGTLLDIGIDENHNLSFTVDTGDHVETYPENHVYVNNYATLLVNLCGSFASPVVLQETVYGDFEITPEEYLQTGLFTHESLPKADRKLHPVLHKLGILELLRSNIWWESLDSKEKIEMSEKTLFGLREVSDRKNEIEDYSPIDKAEMRWRFVPPVDKIYFYRYRPGKEDE